MKRFIASILIFTALTGCVTIPRQSVSLSQELGKMIVSAEQSHLALVDQYILERKKAVDSFLDEKWFPEFMKEFSKTADIEEKIKNEQDPIERSNLIREFSEAAAKKLNQRRFTLHDAIDALGNELRKKLTEHYANIRITNETITAHLNAASKLSSARDDILKQIRISPEQIIPFDKLETISNKLVQYQGKIEGIQDIVGQAKNIIGGN